MRADRIKVGNIVDIGLEREPAEVLDTELEGNFVALRLRQEGKRRGCWVGMSATENVKTLRRLRGKVWAEERANPPAE